MTEDYPRYTTTQIAAFYDVSVETVRTWTEEFGRHLSPTANPGHGRTRAFTVADLEVLALIAESKKSGLTFKDIHAALDHGERGTAPNMPPEELRALVLSERERRLTLELDHTQQQLIRLQQELDTALTQIQAGKEAHEENIRLKVHLDQTEQRLSEVNEQLVQNRERVQTLLDERAKLEREIGEAKGELKTLLRIMQMKGDIPKDE